MTHMENEKKKITAPMVLTRLVSVVVCGIGLAGCIFSLSLQIEEIGTTMSSLVWFSGLAGLVAALAGYASACVPRQKNSWIIPAVLIGIVLSAVCLYLELNYLRSYEVVFVNIAAVAVEAVWLVGFRFYLKKTDPLAA